MQCSGWCRYSVPCRRHSPREWSGRYWLCHSHTGQLGWLTKAKMLIRHG